MEFASDYMVKADKLRKRTGIKLANVKHLKCVSPTKTFRKDVVYPCVPVTDGTIGSVGDNGVIFWRKKGAFKRVE